MTPLFAMLLASQPLPVFPGAQWVPIGGMPGEAGYFTTAARPSEVAGYFLRTWELRGLPTTADGDFAEEGVVAAFQLLEGEMVAVLLRRVGSRTVALCVVRDLWAATRPPPPLGEVRLVPSGPGEVFVVEGSLSMARAAVARIAKASGFEERALSIGGDTWVVEHRSPARRTLTAFTALPQAQVLVWQVDAGEGT